MIQEAEDDYDHTWSSIRHPATQVPRRRTKRQHPHHHAHQEQALTTVPEEIPQLSQLSINRLGVDILSFFLRFFDLTSV